MQQSDGDDFMSAISSAGSDDGSGVQSRSSDESQLARKETQRVYKLRVVVLLAILITGAISSFLTYRNAKRIEWNDFEFAFQIKANRIIESFHYNVERKLGAVDSLAVAIATHGMSEGSTWPFVTIDNFAIRAASARSMADAVALYYLPLVPSNRQQEWEQYSVQNAGWIETGFEFEKRRWKERQKETKYITEVLFTNDTEPVQQTYYTAELPLNETNWEIFRFDGSLPVQETDNNVPLFPLWQSQPVIPDLVNFNFNSSVAISDALTAMLESKKAVLGRVPNYAQEERLFRSLTESWARESGLSPEDPITKMVFPIFDSFDDDTKQVVGALVTVVFWESYFSDAIYDANGIFVVLENDCDQQFTYKIVDGKINFCGEGDLHDKTYDYLAVYDEFRDFVDDLSVGEDLTHRKKISLNEDFCHYTVRVYPTAAKAQHYLSSRPYVQMALVITIFIFTAVIFFCFNLLVERRQSIVLKSANETRRVVNQLFPETFRDRMFQREDQQNAEKPPVDSNLFAWKTNDYRSLESSQLSKASTTDPIADLFPETTVLFADIAGFTSWSSARQPQEVFKLLETLFQCFDKIAEKRKVFKIETIGDCYVAVTGLPYPQSDHAVLMAKFAYDCVNHFGKITKLLESTLGEDTVKLGLRLGMHSGPVTAGVLRGKKSRFQLFGDTVNTASRMESTGEPNRIQCSQSTADALISAHLESWLRPRVGLVKAKGKGEIQTYWVQPVGITSASSDSNRAEERDQRNFAALP